GRRLFRETGRQLDMRRPAELTHRLHPVEAIATGNQELRVAREACRVAAYTGARGHVRCGELLDLFLRPSAWRVEDHRAKAVEFAGNEGPPEQVAVLGRYQRPGAVRGAGQRQQSIARALGGVDFASLVNRERKGPDSSEQVGHGRGDADRLA